MEIILIAAMAGNRVIGRDGHLPWHIPEELKLFKKTTMGYPMVMGRKTFDSFPAPLPGRRHLVLSRNPDYQPNGGERVSSLEEALQLCDGQEKVFIIGGAQIFHQSLHSATGLILTLIDREVEGDVYFPELPDDLYRETARQPYPEASTPFTVITYQRLQG